MNQSKLPAILMILVPQILTLVMDAYQVSEEKAAEMLYTSALYERLEDERAKLWHLSAHALFELFQEELKTGRITYPEEA